MLHNPILFIVKAIGLCNLFAHFFNSFPLEFSTTGKAAFKNGMSLMAGLVGHTSVYGYCKYASSALIKDKIFFTRSTPLSKEHVDS